MPAQVTDKTQRALNYIKDNNFDYKKTLGMGDNNTVEDNRQKHAVEEYINNHNLDSNKTIIFYDNSQPFYEFTNFYKAPIKETIDFGSYSKEITFNSAEHLLQFQKVQHLHKLGIIDEKTLDNFCNKLNQGSAKDAYNAVRETNIRYNDNTVSINDFFNTKSKSYDQLNLTEPQKESIKQFHINKETRQIDILKKKFDQNPDLKDLLLKTKGYDILEAATGKGKIPADSSYGIGENGEGDNILGEALKKVRNKYLLELNQKRPLGGKKNSSYPPIEKLRIILGENGNLDASAKPLRPEIANALATTATNSENDESNIIQIEVLKKRVVQNDSGETTIEDAGKVEVNKDNNTDGSAANNTEDKNFHFHEINVTVKNTENEEEGDTYTFYATQDAVVAEDENCNKEVYQLMLETYKAAHPNDETVIMQPENLSTGNAAMMYNLILKNKLTPQIQGVSEKEKEDIITAAQTANPTLHEENQESSSPRP